MIHYLFCLDTVQQKMAKTTGVLIGNDLNYVQFNSQIANDTQEDTTPATSRRETSDFNMPIDGTEQGRFDKLTFYLHSQ